MTFCVTETSKSERVYQKNNFTLLMMLVPTTDTHRRTFSEFCFYMTLLHVLISVSSKNNHPYNVSDKHENLGSRCYMHLCLFLL